MLLTHRCPADQSTCLGYAESPWELAVRNVYCRNQITPDAITSFLKQTVHQGEDSDFWCLNNSHFN